MEFRSDILKILETARAEISTNMDSQGVTASGRTKKSLFVEDRGESIVLAQDGSGAPIETTQFGRSAGKVPHGFREIIKQWIIDKGIKVEPWDYIRKPSENWQPKYTPIVRGMLRRAGQIAYSIRMKGTKRFLTPNLNIYTQPLKKAISEIQNLVLGKLQAEIKVKI